MARSTFSGPVRSLGGFYTQGPSSVVNIPDATNTISLTVADHAGRLITTNDASLVITLPTISAAANTAGEGPGTGPDTLNNQGASFYIFVETTATALSIKTDGTDKFVGSISLIDTDSSGAVFGYAPAAANDFINFNGSTTGGLAGTWVKVTALKSLKYLVEGVAVASGIPATPFADA